MARTKRQRTLKAPEAMRMTAAALDAQAAALRAAAREEQRLDLTVALGAAAPFVNRFTITTDRNVARIAFVEGSRGDVLPILRTAVTMNLGDLATLRDAIGRQIDNIRQAAGPVSNANLGGGGGGS